MSKYSDHKKPQFDINQYLPEVYKSDVNNSVFDMAFNRHLTKDDTQRVAGVIGESSPTALVKRQLSETTPHRQAYQLAPTMYNKVGSVETALSYKAFLQQLDLIGVDISRIQSWADTLQFNWVPPINIDMLVNYRDYFWNPESPGETPQYFTIENQCNKAKSKLASYDNIVTMRGEIFAISRVNFAANQFVLGTKMDDLFVDGFIFYTSGATNINIKDKFWTVAASVYNTDTRETTITVIEPIAIHATTAPTTDTIGKWWFDTTSSSLKQWNGTEWVGATQAVIANISLSELRSVYQSETNCACSQDVGWDVKSWDDNQIGIVVWDTDMFSTESQPNPDNRIDFATADAWVQWHNARGLLVTSGSELIPAEYSLWYDTTADELNQFVSTSTDGWNVVARNFSAIKARVTGQNFWDYTVGCTTQALNQWSSKNRWMHKSQVRSFGSVQRAALPIFEFSSSLEQNEWAEVTRTWKYRTEHDQSFVQTTSGPDRIELEPVKGYVVVSENNEWHVYLFDVAVTTGRNINYSNTFVLDYQFRIVDDSALSEVYTVRSSQYIEVTAASPNAVQAAAGVGTMCTKVILQGSLFSSPVSGGGPTHVRIEPRLTSQGDAWRGYHIHWMLDTTVETITPITGQSWNILRVADENTDPEIQVVAGNSAYSTFQPKLNATIEIGNAHQQLRLSIPNVKQIDLIPKFRFTGNASTVFATPNSNELRVYVNGVRQYGTYVELTASAAPDYTVIGHLAYSVGSPSITYVTGIRFDNGLRALDVVRMEVGSASFEDMGYECVPVRTVEDETTFAAAVAMGTQPVYRSISRRVLLEQAKTETNQYPLFNVYDVVTGEVVKSAPIFAFREDPAASINGTLQRRIVSSDDMRDFDFEQSLLDRDNNVIYGYRDLSTNQQYWYNPSTKLVQEWDGHAWTSTLPHNDGTSTIYRRAVVSDVAPPHLLTIDYSLWFDTTTNTLRMRSSNTWVSVSGVVITSSDPTLRTVWRRGQNNERAIPSYVDKDRNPVDVGSPDADWAIVDQWISNPEHQNKKIVKFSQIVTHFTSIINAQPRLPGLQAGGVYTLTQNAYNYGIGGTIKEHNDSFDTLISAVNVTNITPPGVLEYAVQEYQSGLLNIRSIFTKLIPRLLTDYSYASIANQTAFVTSKVIAQYENNDARAQVFGDSSAFDVESGAGVRNWIASAPMFGLAKKIRPHLNTIGTFVELVHHDGHRTTVSYTVAELDKMCRLLCNSTDNRTSTAFGKVSISAPPATVDVFTEALGSFRRGTYWYQVAPGIRTLYRLEMIDTSAVAPFLQLNGSPLPDGSMYYNTIDHTTYEKIGNGWTVVGTVGSGNISPMWVEVDLSTLLGNMLLELETRLYDVTPSVDLSFNYDTLTATPSDQLTFNKLYEDRFLAWVRAQEITAPLVNVNYDPTDAFTWNYISSTISVPPRTDRSPGVAGCWQQLYTIWFNTPYPHLEPWKLQNYIDKPTWWDDEYVDTTGSRRWNYNHAAHTGMWENIRTGRVPVGRVLADGSTVSSGVSGQAPLFDYFCVNISDSMVSGFAPDSILPPYIQPSDTDSMIRSLFGSYSAEIAAPDADYVFGDGGSVEWQWTVSPEYVIDFPIIAFKMQPAKFLHNTFGPEFIEVDGLQIDTRFKQVYSHEDALFHGDVFNTSLSYYVRGLNQWYVNYNRSSGFDTNGEFRHRWVLWEPHQTYQFGGIIDTTTFEITNKYIDIADADYNIVLVNNGVFRDLWMDAFEVSLLYVPPPIIQYNNQTAWKLELDTLAAISRPIQYYGVKEYSQLPDPVLNGTLAIVNYTNSEFVVSGNVLSQFPPGTEFEVADSTLGYSGEYTIVGSRFDEPTNQTFLSVVI